MASDHPMSENHETERRRVIRGVITSRRCYGKHLSFVTLQRKTDDDDDDDDGRIKAVFRRAHFQSSPWPSTLLVNHTSNDGTEDKFTNTMTPQCFPTKASDLPYGANVEIDAVETWKDDDDASDPEKLYEIRSWRLVGDHPRTQALQSASMKNNHHHYPKDGTSLDIISDTAAAVYCTEYLRARTNLFLSIQSTCDQKQTKEHRDNLKHTEKAFDGAEMKSRGKQKEDSRASESGHGLNGGSNRAKLFAEWLVENLPLLPKNNCKDEETAAVLDVAGGKGYLSVQLAKLGVPCTVVDPLVRSKRSLRKLDQSQKDTRRSQIPSFVAARFEHDKATEELVTGYSCLVGFHPDECTETIVDVALRHNKIFAVVPCCVFPSLFPLRQLQNGKMVQSYDDFLEYLLQKDARLKRATLAIEGKNQIIYLPSSTTTTTTTS